MATQIDEEELAWFRYITPITEHYCRQIAQKEYQGKRLAYWGHITLHLIPMMFALKQAGADIAVGACNVDSTDDGVAAYLVLKGISVYGWQGMSQVDYRENRYNFWDEPQESHKRSLQTESWKLGVSGYFRAT